MALAVVTSLVGLLAVVITYHREAREPVHASATPSSGPLPSPAEVARVDFPLSFPGYEPAAVEEHLEILAAAYADLYAVAPPEVVARARRRAELRRGGDGAAGAVAAGSAPERRGTVDGGGGASASGSADGRDIAALRAQAALGDIDAQRRSEPGSDA